jgi:hypothetical protein
MRIGRDTAYALVAEGRIPSVRLSRHIRIPRAEPDCPSPARGGAFDGWGIVRQGHIYKRGNTWTYVLDTSLAGHPRHQKSKGGYRTKGDALAALNEAEL